MDKTLAELELYDELVDQSARHLFDGLLTGGSREFRSRLWALLHPVWREEEARRAAVTPQRRKRKAKK